MTGIKIGQGKDTVIHQKKVKGSDWKLADEVESRDKRIVEQEVGDTVDVSISFHKTIPLGNWEFGRVGMGIRVAMSVEDGKKERGIVFGICRKAIDEVLEREEALIKGDKRSISKVDIGELGVSVFIWMDYGLTFKGKLPQETHKIDMSSTRLVPSGDPVEDYVAELQEELGERVFGYQESILDPDDERGF